MKYKSYDDPSRRSIEAPLDENKEFVRRNEELKKKQLRKDQRKQKEFRKYNEFL